MCVVDVVIVEELVFVGGVDGWVGWGEFVVGKCCCY